MRFLTKSLVWLVVLTTTATADVCEDGVFNTQLGFSPWPTDYSFAGIDRTYDFIAENGDIIVHHLDNGVPWEEALVMAPLPVHLSREWQARRDKTSEGMPIFLALTPLNFGRNGLAAAWTDAGEGQALSAYWKDKPLNDPEVITAFINYVLLGVEFFDPAYLAIGIESNILISQQPLMWAEYLELNAAIYSAVKEIHPDLSVFSTIQYEHLRGIESDAKATVAQQQPGVAALMEHSDLMALSTYRYGFVHPNPPSSDYLDMALSFGKPVAIAESGASSAGVMIGLIPLPSSEQTQTDFTSMLLQAAHDHDMPFLINWVSIDFDGMLTAMPSDVRQIAKAWVYTGLETYDGDPKPVLEDWRRCLER